MKSIILASTSPYRRKLMEKLGLDFQAVAPSMDEALEKTRLRGQNASPRELAVGLAYAKAQSIQNLYPQSVVIGSDQLLTMNGEVFDKPGTVERAKEQLRQFSGKTHELITAVCVLSPGRKQEDVTTAKIRFHTLSEDEIANYVTRDNPLDCAGSYKIEKTGLTLMESVDCPDWTAIEGLPLLTLQKLLRSL